MNKKSKIDPLVLRTHNLLDVNAVAERGKLECPPTHQPCRTRPALLDYFLDSTTFHLENQTATLRELIERAIDGK